MLGDRFVEIGNVTHDFFEVHRAKSAPVLTRFHPRNSQQGIEGSEQRVRLIDRRLHRRLIIAFEPAGERLQACAQPGERRSQIVGDVIRDAPHLLHQGLDAI